MPLETFPDGSVQDALLQLEFADLQDVLPGEALFVRRDQRTLRVAQAHDPSTELEDLESGELGDVSRTGDEDLGLRVGEGDTARDVGGVDVGDHLEAVVDETIACGLGPDVGTPPCRALAGKDAHPLVAELLISPEEEADLATAGTL